MTTLNLTLSPLLSTTHDGAGDGPRLLTLHAGDGYPLGAHHHPAHGALRGRIVVAGATGVPQRFYRRFAEYAARRGFDTLTFDYRGVGLSKPATLRGFQAGYRDWARLDLTAAIEAIDTPDAPLFLVGHSFGGHAFGLTPAAHRVARFHGFGVGAGWHGWMPRLEQVRVLAMWRVLGPLMTRAAGYLPWSRLGMGEDLPLGVYRDWRHWCGFPRYFFDDPAMADELHGFAAITAPIVAVNATDDLWAPPASRDAFMAGYRSAPVEAVDLDPRRSGLGPIGHMGYFRPAAEPLWQSVLAGFLAHSRAA